MESTRQVSGFRDRLVLALLAAIGLAISTYLAVYQLGGVAYAWDPLFGSSSSARVLHSFVSRLLPVPDAALGAAGYGAEIVLDLAGGPERWRTHPWLVVAFTAVAGALGVVAIALTIVQLLVVRSLCTLCLGSAAASIAIALAAVSRHELRAALSVISPRREWRRD